MKFKNIKKLTWISLALMLLASSCRDDTFADFRDNNSDEYNLSLTIDLEGMGVRTRAEGKYLGSQIGGGSKIDVIKYAVYYYNTTEQRWEADASYGVANGEEQGVGNVTPGHGQTVLGVEKFPVVINLALKKSETYKLAFWAQNSETEAFVTEDLMKVQMKYKLMDSNENPISVNNDEARDAFCRVIDVAPGTNIMGQTVYLRRPLAQINIGTRGYDYETITRNAPKKYLYSKIRINRAARFLNVVEDKVYTNTIGTDKDEETEAFYTIDYEYEKFPAYWKNDLPNVNEFHPSYTVNDFDNFDYENPSNNTAKSYVAITPSEQEKRIYAAEEFLKVHVYPETKDTKENWMADNDQDGYGDYVGLGDGTDSDDINTETFKYLSMCYVLVNSNSETDEDGNSVLQKDVLNNVKMWIATDKDGSDEIEVLNLNNVPVQRNRRTNIVGQLLTAKANVEIKLDNDFAGQKFDGTNALSGEIVDGFYYAGDHTFEISNLNGLLFFQQLVNGDLTVRELGSFTTNYDTDNIRVGKEYPYYDNNNNLFNLSSKSYSKDDIKNAHLLLEGLRYNDPQRNPEITIKEDALWPSLNNFSFYGCTVKLMEDINLSGIEWIPIGFDLATWDSSIGSTRQPDGPNSLNYATITDKQDGKTVDFSKRRVFAGKFDGNGHTIYNLSTKRFGASVHESAFQNNSTGLARYDCVQWFPQGFFGLVGGPDCEIKDLRLQNVDIHGRNNVAGIVGAVNSLYGKTIIKNCVVDNGTIMGEPMYRGDYNPSNYYGRNIARGVYVGGIVGQYVGNPGLEPAIEGCEVRNLTIIGYRRVGGLVGGIADMEGKDMAQNGIQLDIVITGNSVANTLILCDQFKPFSYMFNLIGKTKWQNGFGWGTGNSTSANSDIFVGGMTNTNNYNSGTYGFNTSSQRSNETEAFHKGGYDNYYKAINTKNSSSNVQFTALSVKPDKDNSAGNNFAGEKREAVIDNVPLKYLPILSSWFIDEVKLNNNYYGKTNVKTRINYKTETEFWYKPKNGEDNVYQFVSPFNFPNSFDIVYQGDEFSNNTALYIESITLDGAGDSNGGRSVITPILVDQPGSCVAFVTSRDRHQFIDAIQQPTGAQPATSNVEYRYPTNINNVVFRGSPYAWAGILMAPNENMSALNLNNVTIYDVYKTLAIDKLSDAEDRGYTDWRVYIYKVDDYGKIVKTETKETVKIPLNVSNSNLRGFTDPGKGWSMITYTKTTFEQGAETTYSNSSNNEEYKTCKVEAPTVFNGCYFKAPFIIDLSNKQGSVTFTNCNATSAYKNVLIDNTKAATASKIIIGTDVHKGETTIKYE